ncbi:NnrS family protein [Thiothrix fructosivorans]|uniref:NnrS family protein n=1 Tax=Thiothrix fructosivorans TaxID=111770 RepID=A0A8B0SSH2_9GAMM|nr:NnrS family protein [Thiothrix fructosivorans]MBO0611475.1 NnrS family protein [Thiothrix fructosivorans]QTX12968.1 NnrS family protein [Thiothrix fructosivorans]
MIKLNIEPPVTGKYALSHLGFRPFFLAAGLFAVIGMVLWTGIYSFGWAGLPADYPAIIWHAHEMVFGYAVAVAAGFLLTAIKNWTGQQTLHGLPLLGLVGVWLLARMLPFTGLPLAFTVLADTLFLLWLLVATAQPIVWVKQWQHLAIVGEVALLLVANAVFYLGLLGYWPVGMQLGLYAGFYIILALIFTMGRRVIPFFIERGVGCPFEARNNVWVDRLSMGLFVAFALADLLVLGTGSASAAYCVAALALVQVGLHGIRLAGWHHPNIWQKPLLWVLYLAYGWLLLGFLLKFLTVVAGVSPWLAVHAFAYGGIAMMTVGMMARVSLGHTGRNVFAPPRSVIPVFLLLFCGAFVRVVAVWLFPPFHAVWILAAQLLWIAAFSLFVWQYLPMLVKPRIDGKYG